MSEKLVAVIQAWRQSPLRFVREVIGAKPTNQQSEALVMLGRLYEAKLARSMGWELTPEMEELSGKLGLSIRSGHGTGKDAWLSWVYLWLLTCFPGARGLVTAPTQHQLHDVLWSEMRKWTKRSNAKLYEFIEIAMEKAYRKDRSGAEDSFIVNRTAKVTGNKEEQGETLAGMHGDYMILAVDEASGVEDGVFRPLEGAMTGKFNIAILIGNPTRNTGYFFGSHHGDRRNWVSLHWNCEETDMDLQMGTQAMGAYVSRMKEKYGSDSNFYRMRVLGEFPLAEPDALISLELILSAVKREVVNIPNQGLVLGIDVAYMGDDLSVICPRRGMVVEPLITYRNVEQVQLANIIAGHMADMSPAAVCVDGIGVGAGVVSVLRHLKKSINNVQVSESAPTKDKYVRLRDELWWRVRERFESRLVSIPNDDELIGELTSIKWKAELNGKIKIESKQDMRKRGLSSPNRADALMLTEYYRDAVLMGKIDRYAEPEAPRKRGWMSA